MKDHPWYMRTEFWAMVVTFGYGVLSQTGQMDAETVKTLTDAAASPEASTGLILGIAKDALSTTWGKVLAIVGAPVAYIISRGLAKRSKAIE